jgi:hypothetical protein
MSGAIPPLPQYACSVKSQGLYLYLYLLLNIHHIEKYFRGNLILTRSIFYVTQTICEIILFLRNLMLDLCFMSNRGCNLLAHAKTKVS